MKEKMSFMDEAFRALHLGHIKKPLISQLRASPIFWTVFEQLHKLYLQRIYFEKDSNIVKNSLQKKKARTMRKLCPEMHFFGHTHIFLI